MQGELVDTGTLAPLTAGIAELFTAPHQFLQGMRIPHGRSLLHCPRDMTRHRDVLAARLDGDCATVRCRWLCTREDAHLSRDGRHLCYGNGRRRASMSRKCRRDRVLGCGPGAGGASGPDHDRLDAIRRRHPDGYVLFFGRPVA